MPTPHAADGHPDLSGIWYHREPGPPVEIRKDGTIAYEFPGVQKDPNAKVIADNPGFNNSPAKNNLPAYKPEYLPKIEELKTKFKNEPQKLNQAMMKLYKEEKVNPFSGCLLMLPQMPLMFGLYQVFRSTIEFRQAYFMSFWPDLSQPDHFPYVMPIIMTVAMFFQQKLSMTDPKQKMMIYIMPLLFFFMMHGLPLGLVLYWTTFSVLSIVESLTVKKSLIHMNPHVK